MGKGPFSAQLVEKFEHSLITKKMSQASCLKTLSPNCLWSLMKTLESACKSTMPSKAFRRSVNLMENAALGLNKSLTEWFRNEKFHLSGCWIPGKMKRLWGRGRSSGWCQFGVRQAGDTAACSTWKLRMDEMDAWMIKWTGIWQGWQAWRGVINGFDV